MMVEKTVNQTKQDNTIKPNKHTIKLSCFYFVHYATYEATSCHLSRL